MKTKENLAVHLPQVDKVLRQPQLSQAAVNRGVLAQLVREELARLRHDSEGEIPQAEAIADMVLQKANELAAAGLKHVINGTGIILNTNLGRAPWAPAVVNKSVAAVSGYSNLEIDLPSGKRGSRLGRISKLLQLLTGCEAALVVNNNAAAVLLAVNSLSKGKEVIVSRGQLVEIGGSFRLPDVIEAAGGILREVGATNCTRISDYEKHINGASGILFKCHRSNFALVGYTEEASLNELVALAGQSNLPLVEDLGSGTLLADIFPGEKQETIADIVAGGCDLITFSGDKLLGGPQAGIIVGKAKLIDCLKKNPLYRALRPDKLIISALEAQLALYLSSDTQKTIPAVGMVSEPQEAIKLRVESFIVRSGTFLKDLRLLAIKTKSTTGGGSLPGLTIESYGIVLQTNKSANQISQLLRTATTPVIAIISDGQVILDFRTIFEREENTLLDVLVDIDRKYLFKTNRPY